ncbi:TetR/AcrR family transcriptional regulator [Aureimonas psammosilenae]|uniref:TetR/AcrR family transcriptional regulator n=1 Tax=Aureimonas psammosilenae TaxID=2495496 RepID=UPI001260D289|nr:TetR/AcrR family transcriptional regulator [Aureimonas psammosilenae]
MLPPQPEPSSGIADPVALPAIAVATKTRRRRKADRPGEIVAAAMSVFAEKGFAAARIDEVAARAGTAKGTVYLYFATKEDLFRAVARAALDLHLSPDAAVATPDDIRLHDEVPRLLDRAAILLADGRLTGIARMIVAEAHTFPDLARIWYEDVTAPLIGRLTSLIKRAQARGEVREGDPRVHAFSIVGPLLTGSLFHDVFGQAGADLPDLHSIARQHAGNILTGLLTAIPEIPISST